MPYDDTPCPDCTALVPYTDSHCRCGAFIGFPNHRLAAAGKDALAEREQAGRAHASGLGRDDLIERLVSQAESSCPIVSMSLAAATHVLRSGKYRTYHQLREAGERPPADPVNAADRGRVGSAIFLDYAPDIAYAALSPDGRALHTYGSVALRWTAVGPYIDRRATILEDNSYTLYDRFGLGTRGRMLPPGHHAVWSDRSALAIAKIGPKVTPATGFADLDRLFLAPGATRDEDVFMEVAIYARDGLDTQDVDCVALLDRPNEAGGRHRADVLQDICRDRQIDYVD